jgi:hypothetical protein
VTEIHPLLSEYRAGLEAEITLLRQLAALAARQREVTTGHALDGLDELSDARDRVMATLVEVESRLRPIRQTLADQQPILRTHPEFQAVASLHREAATLAEDIVAVDAESLNALREAELARRVAADSLERGGSTLAAYRRVVMPALANATLINRKG